MATEATEQGPYPCYNDKHHDLETALKECVEALERIERRARLQSFEWGVARTALAYVREVMPK